MAFSETPSQASDLYTLSRLRTTDAALRVPGYRESPRYHVTALLRRTASSRASPVWWGREDRARLRPFISGILKGEFQ